MGEEFTFTNGVVRTAGPLVGTELLPADVAAGGSEAISSQLLANFVIAQIETLPNGEYSAATNTAGFTALGVQVAGARLVVLSLTGTLTADSALTMPTATNLVAAIPKATVGETYLLRFINNSSAAHQWTITGNASVTVNGTATVSQNTSREFLVALTSLVAVSLQNIGSGGN